MKILFLIGDPPFTAISDWNELKKHKIPTVIPTKEFYSLIKALEQNVEFEQAILNARKRLGLPKEGMDWKTYDNRHNPNLTSIKLTEKEQELELEQFLKSVKEVTEIRKRFNLDYSVNEQLPHLIYGNFVYPQDPPIMWGINAVSEDNDDEYYNYIAIMINNPVTKNELITYIENNWEDIKRSTHNLPPKPSAYISLRDRRIIELRDKEKMPFKDIADKIMKEFEIDDFDGKVNEDSVKTAYKRAKDKIISLIASSEGNR